MRTEGAAELKNSARPIDSCTSRQGNGWPIGNRLGVCSLQRAFRMLRPHSPYPIPSEVGEIMLMSIRPPLPVPLTQYAHSTPARDFSADDLVFSLAGQSETGWL